MNTRTLASVAIVASVALAAACGQVRIPEGGADGVTITDSSGQELTIPLPVERVAVLDRGTADVMRALGVLDTLVGSHESMSGDPFWPEIQEVPIVATYSEVSFEALAEVEPQVVVSSVRAHGVVTENELLNAFDIADIKLSLRNPELIKDEVALLGKIFQREDRAQELIDFYTHYEDLIAGRIAGVPEAERARVFVEYHAGEYHTGGPGSRFYEQVVLAGGLNVAADIAGEIQVDAEWVAEQNPDVIIREAGSPAGGYEVTDTAAAEELRDEIMKRPVIDSTQAVSNVRVYLLPIDIYSRPGYIVGVAYMAKWLYPDLFEDLDPVAVHRHYLDEFHGGLEYRGVWGYPAS